MESMSINWLSVIGATLTAFVIGGLWYGPLFGKTWMRELGISEADMQARNMPAVFGIAFLLSLIAAINLEMFLGPQADLGFGAAAGFAAGLGWVGMFLGILYLFEHRSLLAWAVNAGYCTLALTVMGAILGAW